ncbi:hypothetical protein [Algihabitans albus]|uniref:hypothetical protein n=1 Tax=Algihabitans albus TaxID=2164067 RepID=UPI000E5CDE88|nr:hypothetical protein [Algihabitans albus]
MTDLSALSPRGPVAPLPMFRTLFEAQKFTLWRLGQLSFAAAVPFSASTASLLVMAELWAEPGMRLPLLLTAFFVNVCAFSLFAVAWHRAFLLDETPRLFPLIRRRHLHFALLFLPFFMILLFYNIPLGAGVVFSVDHLILLLFFFGEEVTISPNLPRGFATIILLLFSALLSGSYLLIRLVLVLPAIAIDERFSFGDSWRKTAGNAWSLVGACVWPSMLAITIASLPILLQRWFLANGRLLFSFSWGREEVFLSFFALLAIGYVFAAVLVAVLSLSFRTCTGWAPDEDMTPPATSAPSRALTH